MAGRHRSRPRLSRRGRIVGGLVVVTTLAAGVIGWTALRAPGLVIPDDSCATPPPLRTWHGVTLQPLAMAAFKQAHRAVGRRIEVVESYRSCEDQRKACLGICSNPDGCPGLCAPPGKSWHQLGAAVDITQASLDDSAIVAALEEAGWCQALPGSDPGHFSFDGCH
jgi:D-alanyl-D-alanine carboxypeptidase-like protein